MSEEEKSKSETMTKVLHTGYRRTGDARLRNALVCKHRALVRYIAKQQSAVSACGALADIDDFVQSGTIGLMDAIEKYRADKNTKFMTYAAIRIKGEIKDSLRGTDGVPLSARKKLSRIHEAYRIIGKEPGEDGETDALVAKSLNIDEKKMMQLLIREKINFAASIQEIEDVYGYGIDSIETGDALRYEPDFDDELMKEELEIAINDALIDCLTEKERDIVIMYYFNDMKQEEIGQKMGVTESRVNQILTKAKLKLQKQLLEYREVCDA